MIRDPIQRLASLDARRVWGLLALAAVALLVLVGGAHAVGESDHGHDACSVCDAYLASAAVVVGVAIATLLRGLIAREHAAPPLAPVLVRRAVRLPAPRGPPRS